MKMLDCKRKAINGFGYIDPHRVHGAILKDKPLETEHNLLRFLTKQHFCNEILFSYHDGK